ncbi:MAG: cytochrome-c peroxidase [Longimicrobiales bacterium]
MIRSVRSGLLLATAGAFAVACGESSPASPGTASELIERYGLQPMPAMIHPVDNQPNPDRIELGKLIFFDPLQSADMDVACSTCHLPDFGFADGRDLPLGPSGEGLGPERVLTNPDMIPEGRHSPTVINVGFNQFGAQAGIDGFMFWDGRKRRLENLVLLPQREFSEMRADVYPISEVVDTLVARFRDIPEYELKFREAFPAKADSVDQGLLPSAVDSLSLAQALSQFIRSLESTNSPYDQFVGGDEGALTPEQQRGLALFNEKAGCATCHSGPLFSDFRFHIVGARQLGPGFQGTPHEDFGRWGVTRIEQDKYKFRTPSLRNASITAPYMHSGGYETLEDVIDFFDRGGGDHPNVLAETIELVPLGLSDREKRDLVAFLEALTDMPEVQVPDTLPSGLEPPH